MRTLKILVVGRHYGANTVIRRVQSYEGCAVEQIDGVGKARYPDCDLAIVCIRVVSHEIYYKVRDHYKPLGVPVIYIESGWSEVVNDFENWLQKTRGFVQRINPEQAVRVATAAQGKHVTTMAAALTKAAAHLVETTAAPEPDPVADTKRSRRAYPKTFNRAMAEAIFAAMKGGQSNKEIAFTLAQAKIRKNNGTSMSTREVADYILRHDLRSFDDLGQWPSYARSIGVEPDPLPVPHTPMTTVIATLPAPAAPPPPPPVSTPPPAVAEAPETRTHAERMHDLIGKVLASKNLDLARKLELVEEIHAGVRTTDRQVIAERLGDTLQLTEQSIFQPGDRALVTLDKTQAIAIIEHYTHVKAFADES